MGGESRPLSPILRHLVQTRIRTPLRIPGILIVIDAEDLLIEGGVLLHCLVLRDVEPMKDTGVFSGHLDGVDLGIISFTVLEVKGGAEDVAGTRGDCFHVLEAAEVAIEGEDDGIEEEALVAGLVDDVDIGIGRVRGADEVSFTQIVLSGSNAGGGSGLGTAGVLGDGLRHFGALCAG